MNLSAPLFTRSSTASSGSTSTYRNYIDASSSPIPGLSMIIPAAQPTAPAETHDLELAFHAAVSLADARHHPTVLQIPRSPSMTPITGESPIPPVDRSHERSVNVRSSGTKTLVATSAPPRPPRRKTALLSPLLPLAARPTHTAPAELPHHASTAAGIGKKATEGIDQKGGARTPTIPPRLSSRQRRPSPHFRPFASPMSPDAQDDIKHRVEPNHPITALDSAGAQFERGSVPIVAAGTRHGPIWRLLDGLRVTIPTVMNGPSHTHTASSSSTESSTAAQRRLDGLRDPHPPLPTLHISHPLIGAASRMHFPISESRPLCEPPTETSSMQPMRDLRDKSRIITDRDPPLPSYSPPASTPLARRKSAPAPQYAPHPALFPLRGTGAGHYRGPGEAGPMTSPSLADTNNTSIPKSRMVPKVEPALGRLVAANGTATTNSAVNASTASRVADGPFQPASDVKVGIDTIFRKGGDVALAQLVDAERTVSEQIASPVSGRSASPSNIDGLPSNTQNPPSFVQLPLDRLSPSPLSVATAHVSLHSPVVRPSASSPAPNAHRSAGTSSTAEHTTSSTSSIVQMWHIHSLIHPELESLSPSLASENAESATLSLGSEDSISSSRVQKRSASTSGGCESVMPGLPVLEDRACEQRATARLDVEYARNSAWLCTIRVFLTMIDIAKGALYSANSDVNRTVAAIRERIDIADTENVAMADHSVAGFDFGESLGDIDRWWAENAQRLNRLREGAIHDYERFLNRHDELVSKLVGMSSIDAKDDELGWVAIVQSPHTSVTQSVFTDRMLEVLRRERHLQARLDEPDLQRAVNRWARKQVTKAPVFATTSRTTAPGLVALQMLSPVCESIIARALASEIACRHARGTTMAVLSIMDDAEWAVAGLQVHVVSELARAASTSLGTCSPSFDSPGSGELGNDSGSSLDSIKYSKAMHLRRTLNPDTSGQRDHAGRGALEDESERKVGKWKKLKQALKRPISRSGATDPQSAVQGRRQAAPTESASTVDQHVGHGVTRMASRLSTSVGNGLSKLVSLRTASRGGAGCSHETSPFGAPRQSATGGQTQSGSTSPLANRRARPHTALGGLRRATQSSLDLLSISSSRETSSQSVSESDGKKAPSKEGAGESEATDDLQIPTAPRPNRPATHSRRRRASLGANAVFEHADMSRDVRDRRTESNGRAGSIEMLAATPLATHTDSDKTPIVAYERASTRIGQSTSESVVHGDICFVIDSPPVHGTGRMTARRLEDTWGPAMLDQHRADRASRHMRPPTPFIGHGIESFTPDSNNGSASAGTSGSATPLNLPSPALHTGVGDQPDTRLGLLGSTPPYDRPSAFNEVGGIGMNDTSSEGSPETPPISLEVHGYNPHFGDLGRVSPQPPRSAQRQGERRQSSRRDSSYLHPSARPASGLYGAQEDGRRGIMDRPRPVSRAGSGSSFFAVSGRNAPAPRPKLLAPQADSGHGYSEAFKFMSSGGNGAEKTTRVVGSGATGREGTVPGEDRYMTSLSPIDRVGGPRHANAQRLQPTSWQPLATNGDDGVAAKADHVNNQPAAPAPNFEAKKGDRPHGKDPKRPATAPGLHQRPTLPFGWMSGDGKEPKCDGGSEAKAISIQEAVRAGPRTPHARRPSTATMAVPRVEAWDLPENQPETYRSPSRRYSGARFVREE